MNMSELEKMRREWVDVTRRNGFREGITDLLAHQYSKKSHFIFELLQNAEDAFATEIEFRIEDQRLVFKHNGEKLFSDENVESITSIGKSTKLSDYTQIGKHGIGFKAVFAYTHTPRIHSGDKHFDIDDVVIPCFLGYDEIPSDLKPDETRILLPFDSDEIPHDRRFRDFVPAETAKAEISIALDQLSLRTLLFLRHINKIQWHLVNGGSGAIFRKPMNYNNDTSFRYVDLKDNVKTENWIIFEKKGYVLDDGKPHECIVEVAFLIENGKVIPAKGTELVVYFPTDKKTGLNFLIQGPFKTTKARDNIKDDPANQELLKIAGCLAAESLETLRDLDLLNVNSFRCLPLHEPEDPFFYPVYEQIRAVLKAKSILPAHNGTFIKVQDAKLARGKELVELFSEDQIGMLFAKEKLFWLDGSITESGSFADLHTYLVGTKKYQWSREWETEPLHEGLLVDAESLVPKLTAQFLLGQSLDWLIKLINYIIKPQSSSELKRTPFIRLVSGKQVALPVNEKVPRPAWFAPVDDNGLELTVFPIVHQELSTNEPVRKFLEKEGIRELDAVAIVEKSILPKYHGIEHTFNESIYRADLRRIRDAYVKASDIEKAQLINILNANEWLASVHASGKGPNDIVWKKPGTADLFERTSENANWFEGLVGVNAFFLHESVIETLGGSLVSLAKTKAELTLNICTADYTIRLSNQYYNHKQGLKGFDPKATVVGIESAIANWNQSRSVTLWKILLSAPLKLICGKTQHSTNRSKLDKAPIKIEYTNVGELCLKTKWLIDKEGVWHKPNNLLLSDLYDGYETTSFSAKELSLKLGMRQPEREQAIEIVTGGDLDLKRLIEHYQSAPQEERIKILKSIPKEVPPEPAPSFKSALEKFGRTQRGESERGNTTKPVVSDPDRYQEKLNENVNAEVQEHLSTPRKITFSPVRNDSSNVEARRFLYEEYKGYCQITNSTFPKASRRSGGATENYFEACALTSYANANYLNNPGNMLCVSADTMAKLKYASIELLEDFESVIRNFQKNGETAECVFLKIRLAGEDNCIKWSQRHFMRLVALYEET